MKGKKNGTTSIDDALWAATADTCHGDKPSDGERAAARKVRA
jgi:hypothetical protein